ncbi:L-glyceraldehyde 3-phosphate reductase [Christiangramia forsetii]|uniref:Aldo/keto reductase family protein n=2 Tax=Christiangramia forsetii TaxID=411153 RepID=A0M217_CHRFK|nr:L-glyceraldehyde 3-phosphate reductase [Christiangramia forsetii]GGG44781.1 glyceraldehyde 3-phosphate reductase [Christiangramia forsetii]CAL66662.1 aldo/keto reductase family protein [Christiangramia forsetii KT0803]
MNQYIAQKDRYDKMQYRRCGKSGIKLPLLSLGLWHNFGDQDDFENSRNLLRKAFDNGITHFDLANNYGPPYGSAEKNFGKIFQEDFKDYRDQLIISTKAGWDMWPGPHGNFGSRKYLIASLDQSLKRMGLEYVDIFYHHRPDPETPLEETMGALDQIVRQGKALYVGISQYSAEDTLKASEILKDLGTPFLIHQPRYNMMDRWVENGLLDTLEKVGIGSIVFSPLEQGILTSKYLRGIPEDSRAATEGSYLDKSQITDEVVNQIQQLDKIAQNRDQSLAQMAVAWLLKDKRVTSVLVGVSKVSQLEDNIEAIKNLHFNDTELKEINTILNY